MKKTILITVLATTLVTALPCSAKAGKHNPYYTIKGTVKNFTYTMKYKDGTVLKGKGYNVYLKDGAILEIDDTDTDKFFKEGQKVKVKFHDNGTRKNKLDDKVISVKKAK